MTSQWSESGEGKVDGCVACVPSSLGEVRRVGGVDRHVVVTMHNQGWNAERELSDGVHCLGMRRQFFAEEVRQAVMSRIEHAQIQNTSEKDHVARIEWGRPWRRRRPSERLRSGQPS